MRARRWEETRLLRQGRQSGAFEALGDFGETGRALRRGRIADVRERRDELRAVGGGLAAADERLVDLAREQADDVAEARARATVQGRRGREVAALEELRGAPARREGDAVPRLAPLRAQTQRFL